MDIAKTAPIANELGYTESQVINYFDKVIVAPTAPILPEITSAKYKAVADALYSSEGMTELRQKASDIGLAPSQVKTIIAELKALEAEYKAAE